MQQLEIDFIHHTANNVTIDQRQSDGYINGTALCKAADKSINHYYTDNAPNEAFLKALSAKTGMTVFHEKQGLIQIRKGSPANGGGTWVHPKVAIHLAQWASADFAVLVTDWVEEYWQMKSNPMAPAALPDYFNRYLLNQSRITVGYFSILQLTTIDIVGPLHHLGCVLDKSWSPDASVGKMYCKHLRDDLGFDTSKLETYWHVWTDGRPPVQAYLYPDELLPDCKKWIAEKYVPVDLKAYVKRKDPSKLAYVSQHPLLQLPKKPTPKKLAWNTGGLAAA